MNSPQPIPPLTKPVHPAFALFLASLLFPVLPSSGAVSQAAMDLLYDAEISRGVFPSTGLEWKVEAKSESASSQENATLLVRSQHGRALAQVLAPETSRGKKYLLAEGSMYFYRPGTQRPVNVPARQQVAGDAAIGDIASTSFLLEYAPVSVKPDSHQDERCALFRLNAREDVTASYSHILLWVSETDRVIRKAEFYTRLGRHIRTANFTYGSELELEEKTYPFLTSLEVIQLLGIPKTTVLEFSEVRLAEFPGEMFNKDSLARERGRSLFPGILNR